MDKLGWISAALFAALFAALSAYLAYTFVLVGKVEPADDGRTAIVVSGGERDFVLSEMRQFLESVQQITEGLQKNDMKQVATAAKAAGMGLTHNVPPSLRGKLPLEFKKLGHSTHAQFDLLAEYAATLPDQTELLARLSGILENCTNCHAGFRFKVSE